MDIQRQVNAQPQLSEAQVTAMINDTIAILGHNNQEHDLKVRDLSE